MSGEESLFGPIIICVVKGCELDLHSVNTDRDIAYGLTWLAIGPGLRKIALKVDSSGQVFKLTSASEDDAQQGTTLARIVSEV